MTCSKVQNRLKPDNESNVNVVESVGESAAAHEAEAPGSEIN